MTTTEGKTEYSIEFVGIDFSPWSLRAKWALAYHNVPYEYTVYTPKISEPWLRYRTGKWTGDLTVPVVFARDLTTQDTTILTDSFDIAKFADSIGSNPCKLFPADEHMATEIELWHKKASAALDHLRISSLMRNVDDEELKQEALPGWAKSCGFISNYVYRSAVNYILNKYERESQSIEENDTQAKKYLNEIREQLAKGKGDYLLDDQLTYADITVACVLQLVKPMPDQYYKLKPGQRRGMTSPFHEEYSDLLEWRDKLASRHCTIQQHESKL